jgi:hypothetical protein
MIQEDMSKGNGDVALYIVITQYSVYMIANVRCKYLNFLQFSFNA